MSGCSGSCCVAFPLSCEREDLLDEERFGPDGPYIHAMTIPLSDEDAAARAALFGVELQGDGPFFMCTHWNEETRLCGAYAARPKMCRGYPYERRDGCEHGCDCRGELWDQVWGVTEPSPWPGLYRIVGVSRRALDRERALA